jgi:hypothetical protein
VYLYPQHGVLLGLHAELGAGISSWYPSTISTCAIYAGYCALYTVACVIDLRPITHVGCEHGSQVALAGMPGPTATTQYIHTTAEGLIQSINQTIKQITTPSNLCGVFTQEALDKNHALWTLRALLCLTQANAALPGCGMWRTVFSRIPLFSL